MRDLQNILIIRFSSLGDIVLASPLVRILRTTYPDARIDFLVKSEYAPIIKYNPHLSTIIELITTERDELKALKKTICTTQYDAIIDIHNSFRSRYLRLFSGVRYVSVVHKRVFARWILVNLKKNIYRKIVPVADRYIEAVKKFGVQDDGVGLEIFLPEEATTTIASLMSKFKLERYDHIIGFAPGARHFTKRWLPERFVELGVRLGSTGKKKIFIFGSKEETEYCGDIAQMINSRCNASVAANLAGAISLLETPPALDYCDMIISNDTGMMHLAAARKKSVIAIFGSTVREFGFFPYATESVVIERNDLSCKPCTHIGRASCPEGHFRCMKDITVEEVLAAAEHMLLHSKRAINSEKVR
jgi:lipopolysaccharide heptosyltransferase II